MSKRSFNWAFVRLNAVKLHEIWWKFTQTILRLREKRRFENKNKLIISKDIYSLNKLSFQGIYVRKFETKGVDLYTVELFDHYRINMNKRIPWHNAFGNMKNAEWPLEFSYNLNYMKKNGYGCARINWELNRFQFMPLIAMHYVNSGDTETLIQIKRIFYDWVKNNPFLMGISWTNTLEISMRSISWIITASLLKNQPKLEKFTIDMSNAARNQLQYIKEHHSRYSSAGNELIIEMTALALGGIAFRDREMLKYAMETLTVQLNKQISSDGVDKEQSIYYHALVTEAIAILVIQLKKQGISYAENMDTLLGNMGSFLSNIIDEKHNIPSLGDDDGGKIINLINKEFNYYEYVLQLVSMVLQKNFIELDKINKNLLLFFDMEKINQFKSDSEIKSVCYKEGGITILKYRKDDLERVMTFDHGPLGLEASTAHGHGDALSVTLSVDGTKFLIDPGTYIYYNDLGWRNYFRRTINHNTITVDDMEQSEMLGEFMWGKKVETRLNEFNADINEDFVSAEHYGYKSVVHHREITYKKPDLFIIKDDIDGEFINCVQSFIIDPAIKVMLNHNLAELYDDKNTVYIYSSEKMNLEKEYASEIYTKKKNTNAIRCSVNSKGVHTEITTVISINKKISDEILRRYYNNNKEEVNY